ncbi:MAG: BrnA antitoxin family protein [Xenococcus sp. (in: cyanobacteria)]
MSNTSKTDWARIDAMTDEDIDTSDIPPLTDEFFAKAKLRLPTSSNTTVAVEVDSETLEWFQQQGEAASKQMSAALRIYAAAHKYSA